MRVNYPCRLSLAIPSGALGQIEPHPPLSATHHQHALRHQILEIAQPHAIRRPGGNTIQLLVIL
jgi:hypothetical protein